MKVTLEKFLKNHDGRTRRAATFCSLWLPALLILPFLCGCVSKSQARAEAKAAYLAGQRDAYAAIAAHQRTSIQVIGQVQNSEVPWAEGLTLAQAIAAANFTGDGTPKEIILMRRGESAIVSPKDMLNGHDVPLEPGDTITLRP